MDTYKLQNDVKTFGFRVKTFPDGIKEAFDSLLKLFPSGDQRSYYGVSESSKDDTMLYYALAEEKSDGEGKKYGYEEKVIEKGDYLIETLKNWQSKTDSINGIFGKMLKDKRVLKGKACVEWYKTMDEMLCMVSADLSKR